MVIVGISEITRIVTEAKKIEKRAQEFCHAGGVGIRKGSFYKKRTARFGKCCIVVNISENLVVIRYGIAYALP